MSQGEAANQTEVFGFLAALKLLGMAAADRRLKAFEVRVFACLISFINQNGECCVSVSLIARAMGAKRERVQHALKKTENTGYITSFRRSTLSGGEGAKRFIIHLDRARTGAPRAIAPEFGRTVPKSGGSPCPQKRGQAVPRTQGADKKVIMKPIKDSDSGVFRASRVETRNGITPSANLLHGEASERQQTISSTRKERPKRLLDRINKYNLDQMRELQGRFCSEWSRLDPDYKLLDSLGAGQDKAYKTAEKIEFKTPGAGLKYLAAAVEKATKGEKKAQAILAGRYSKIKPS